MGQTDDQGIRAEAGYPMASTDEGRLVEAAKAGDGRAFGQLFDQWFDRVHDLSRRIVRDEGIAGEVAQDAFLKAWTKLDSLDDVDAFGGWLLRIARNGSLNRLEKERRTVSVDDETMTAAADARAPEYDPLARMDQAARIDLVWDAAAALGPRDASVLDLHLRHGLTPAELAEELGCTPNNAHQVLFTMRKRLATSVKALVLWRAGHPTCDDLRQGLAAAKLTAFGGPMVKAIDRHAGSCDTCSGEREDRLAPAALFSAAPVVAAAYLIKASAAAGLASQGVPMAGSLVAAGGGSGETGETGQTNGGGTSRGDAPLGERAGLATAGAVLADGAELDVDEAPPFAGDDDDEPRGGRKTLLLAALALLVLLLLAGVALLLQQPADDPVEVATETSQPGEAAGSTTITKTPTGSAATTVVAPGPTKPKDSDISPGPTKPGDSAGPMATTIPTVVIPGPGGTPAGPTPGGPVVLAPPPASPPTPRTPPAVSTTTTTTTAPPAAVPTIDSFTAVPDSTVTCTNPFGWKLTWTTTGATGVTVSPTDAPGTLAPHGSTTVCALPGSTFTLVASGPGGQVTDTAP